MFQRRYPRGLSITLSSDNRELRRNYLERGIETTPARRRLIVTWRWCAPPACHLTYSARPDRRGDSREVEGASFKRYRRRFLDDAIDGDFRGIANLSRRRENVCVSVKLRALLPVSRACTTHYIADEAVRLGGESRGCRPEGHPGRYVDACATPYHPPTPCALPALMELARAPPSWLRLWMTRIENGRRGELKQKNKKATLAFACWYL